LWLLLRIMHSIHVSFFDFKFQRPIKESKFSFILLTVLEISVFLEPSELRSFFLVIHREWPVNSWDSDVLLLRPLNCCSCRSSWIIKPLRANISFFVGGITLNFRYVYFFAFTACSKLHRLEGKTPNALALNLNKSIRLWLLNFI
jgi:hypothetical protein